ncbi:S41 family peptidase [Saccharicrinis aurantiacus]|uniref:S41 family peptidase n=1 Tax=Saccharicrinis aurantiacus TaxID=1849719 RepID=UPI0024937AB4|nr:S41 family peptidase [Saccharicrinis aurantiacus]
MKITYLIILLLFSFNIFSQQLTRTDKIKGLSQIWKEVEYNYPNYKLQNVGWDSLYYSNINKIDSFKTDKEYFEMLSKFLAVFHEGHTYVYTPKEIHKKVGAKIWPLYTHNKIYIIGVGKELKDKIPLGSELLKVNGIDIFSCLDSLYKDFYYAEHVKYHHLIREVFYDVVGTRYEIQFKAPNSIVNTVNIEVTDTDTWDWDEIKFSRKSYKDFHFEIMDDISYINFGTNINPDPMKSFESVIDSIQKTKGIVFDLRGNRGGACIRSEISKYFTADSIFHPYSVKVRVNNSYRRASGQFNENYTNFYQNNAFKSDTAVFKKEKDITINIPVVILVNESTISEAESFIICFRALDKAYVIGKPSQGSATYPLIINLPLGAYAKIATQRVYCNGKMYTYIEPDLELEPTIEDVLNGYDVVLVKALTYLNQF